VIISNSGESGLKISGNTITAEHASTYTQNTYNLTATYTTSDSKSYTCNLTAVLVKGTKNFNLKCTPNYIARDPQGQLKGPIKLRVAKQLIGGEYMEDCGWAVLEEQNSGFDYVYLYVSDTQESDRRLQIQGEYEYDYSPPNTCPQAIIELKAGDNYDTAVLVDVDILSEVKDGLGVKDIPANPGIGDIFTYVG
jgi:hypothetical protein